MDRVIKFRAWNKEEQRMVPEYQDIVELDTMEFMNEDYVLMQFTGMTDKTGRKVYEGDLIVFDDPLTVTYDKQLHYEIIWDQRRTPGWALRSLELVEDEVFPTKSLDASSIAGSGRIVGNVWENPELRPAQRITLSRWIASNAPHFNGNYHHENPTR